MKRLISITLIVTILIMCLSGCGILQSLFADAEEPQTTDMAEQNVEATIARCLSACHKVDIDGILDCVAPEVSKPAKTMLNLAGKLNNKSDEEMLNTMLSLLGAEGTTDAAGVCKTLEVEIQNIDVNGDNAKVAVNFEFEQNEQRYEGETTVTCKCVNGKWYIYTLNA